MNMEDAADAMAKPVMKKSVADYVEKVYENGGFLSLGIGK
jgi:hypothetical protein